MKIKVISPITTEAFKHETQLEAEKWVSHGTHVETEAIQYGTASIESAYDEILCGPGIIRVAEDAEKNGYDGIFISCMGDPAVHACRERLDIPVVGPARTSMLFASELAHSFSIVTILENVVVLLKNLALEAGVDRKLNSVRSIDIPVLDLVDKQKLIDALVGESIKAIEEDKTHAIILGCTGMIDVAESLHNVLVEEGYQVPVIDPVPVSIRYLEMLISLKLVQSKKTYMPLTEKERNIWDLFL